MSLHTETTHTIKDDSVGTGKIGWKAACSCGFVGPDQYDDRYIGESDQAHADYRAHIEEALGADAYYNANVACRNCGSHHTQPCLVGAHIMSSHNVCTNCGTTMLQPDNDVWDESKRRSSLFGF